MKVAIVFLADVGSGGDMGSMADALVTAQESIGRAISPARGSVVHDRFRTVTLNSQFPLTPQSPTQNAAESAWRSLGCSAQRGGVNVLSRGKTRMNLV